MQEKVLEEPEEREALIGATFNKSLINKIQLKGLMRSKEEDSVSGEDYEASDSASHKLRQTSGRMRLRQRKAAK